VSTEKRRILVGTCGSIAAFKACELIRVLMREGAEVSSTMIRDSKSLVARKILDHIAKDRG
jgi:phosphopantothenoylcysteine synthetase/decarboxylase